MAGKVIEDVRNNNGFKKFAAYTGESDGTVVGGVRRGTLFKNRCYY